ncbi:RDD family protein [Arthrobacter sp. 24S4-2]|uniref:RDD family protein n=1 Tax=Arthrobacter sp. 24S4-2 TaxID=2575374 RepID=UPI001586E80C|nr:RDD family protein [Arthrobacter sp. 24S4-2]
MAGRSSSSNTGLIDAVNGRPVRVHPASGTYYVSKAGWPHFWGRGLDAVVVIVVGVILMAVLNSLVQNLALGSLSLALLSSGGLYFAALAVIWFVVLFAYGMVCGTVGSLGDAAVGMRSVRIADGTTSGAWLGGWRSVCWSFAPLYFLLAFASALSGGSGDTFDEKFRAVDLRSGVAQGAAPIRDPELAGR